MDLTDKENKLLYRYLGDNKGESVTEFEHEIYPNAQICTKCSKTVADNRLKMLPEYTKPCLAPPQYPGSDADIADKIRVWMEKADGDTKLKYRAWLITSMNARGFPAITEALIYDCTPTDKITAALKVWEDID